MKLLTKSDICERLKIRRSTLRRMIRAGDFPFPVKLAGSSHLSRWTEADFSTWQAENFSEIKNEPVEHEVYLSFGGEVTR